MTFHIMVGEPRAVARRLRNTPNAVVLNSTFTDDCEGLVVIAKTENNIVSLDTLGYSIKTDILENGSRYVNAVRDDSGWLPDEEAMILAHGYFLTKGGPKIKVALQEYLSPEAPALPAGTKAQINFDADTNKITVGAINFPDGPVWIGVSETGTYHYFKYASVAAAVANFSYIVNEDTIQPTIQIKTMQYQTNSSLWLDPREDMTVNLTVATPRGGFIDTDTGEQFDAEANSNAPRQLVIGNYQDIKAKLAQFDNVSNARIGAVSILRQDRTEFYVLEVVLNSSGSDE